MSKKTNYNFKPRELMEKAIEVMRQTVNEQRDDGEKSPKVGAVLVRLDGTTETASRGELRQGEHAEFTLLERKNRDVNLDGAIMFVTLEPCAPGARQTTKFNYAQRTLDRISCAQRITLARISEVWIGIQDPDPTVARKGMEYLVSKGVKVHMFDRDLQEVIESENEEFLLQSSSRAKEASGKKTEVILSKHELIFANSLSEDFSASALEVYRAKLHFPDTVESSAFRRLLIRQGFLKEERCVWRPTGFGLLLFGKQPRSVMPQSGLFALINFPNGNSERKEFDNPLIQIPLLVDIWLKDKLPNFLGREKMQRSEKHDLPFEMIREGIINALVHRDYDIEGAKCQLTVTSDTVVIKSPGRPLTPITVEQLKSFTAPMLSRNPQLHYVFAKTDLAEAQGLGIQTLKSEAEKLGLPPPTYTWSDPYLELTIFLST